MARITKKQIARQIDEQKHVFGYERFHIEHRYDYYAIDELDAPRPANNVNLPGTTVQDHRRTYKVGLTLKQAYQLVEALIYGADTIKKERIL